MEERDGRVGFSFLWLLNLRSDHNQRLCLAVKTPVEPCSPSGLKNQMTVFSYRSLCVSSALISD